MEKFMENAKKYSKFIGLGAAALIIISILFLPFLKVSVSILGISASESAKFIESWEGKVALICAILIGVAIFLKKNKLASIPTLLTLVFTIWGVIDGKGENAMGLAKISCSWGFYLILVGVVAVAFFLYLDMKESKKSLKEYFDFKSEIDTIKNKTSKKEEAK